VTCPRCAAAVAGTQEYCLECGLRLPGTGRFGIVPLRERRIALPLLVALVAAAGGAVAAIAATRDTGLQPLPIVATGGSIELARRPYAFRRIKG